MTKSEFQLSIDRIMDRHEVSIAAKFHEMEGRFDNKLQIVSTEIKDLESRMDRQFLKIDGRYNWIIGVTITTGITIFGMLIKILFMFPH